ncbi:MAG: TIGR00730 family Rossman fold protein [Methyloligellaceae bacterium]
MSRKIRNICVYCGSGTGNDPAFAQAARALGQDFAAAGIGLVYGGGTCGLMGEIARSVLKAGGHVTGIIPDFLQDRELAFRDAQELIVTRSMHDRKQLMFEKADAFVALPGGVGTLEELIEQLTWSQLGQHSKPMILANLQNYWEPLLEMIERMKQEAFIRTGLELDLLHVVERVEDVLPAIFAMAEAYEARSEEGSVPAKL